MNTTRKLGLGLSLLLACASPSIASEGTPAPRKAPRAEAAHVSSKDLACLAEAIYFEAGGTGSQGAAAVAHVVVNRSQSAKFPGSVCGVVSEGCQFSYRCDGRPDALANEKRREEAVRIAKSVLAGSPDITKGALFFHSAKASPGWFKTRPRVGVIGGNVFYR